MKNYEKSIFSEFCLTVKLLRSSKGCPWDKKQTAESLKKYIKEECGELLEAITDGNHLHTCEENGDLLFLLVLLAQIAEETGTYTMNDVITGINDKMIRRHPHVFGDAKIQTEEELKSQWKKIKSAEALKK